jgi:hypothetical protein
MNAFVDATLAATVADGDPVLARLDRLIEREIGRLRARYELSLDEFRGLYVSDDQVDALLRRAAPHVDLGVVPPPLAPEPDSRWSRLADALALDSDDLDIVLLALASEINAKYEVLFAYLNNDVTRKWPTAELALRLFGRDERHRLRLRQRLGAEAPLLQRGALEFIAATRDAPRMQRGLRLPSALADWLLGLEWQDERLAGMARLVPAAAGNGASLGTESKVLERLALRDDSEAPVLVVSGSSAPDAVGAALQVLHANRRDVVVVDLLVLRTAAAPQEAATALALMQAVLGCALVATPIDALADADGRPLDQPCAALRRLARSARPLLVAAATGMHWRDALGDVRAVEVPLPELDVPQRLAVWRTLLSTHGAAVDEDALLALADRFVLGPERIDSAVRHANDLARAEQAPKLVPAHLNAAARAVSVEGSAEVVRPMRQQHAWNDLVVPAEVQQRLRDLVHAVTLRPLVYDRWNFSQPGGGQRGIKAMFTGASGTGKTMAAAIVARELGLDLHRIELAAVMSKYIGETEKNLDRAFNAARRANAILFIDEADALLGKRSEVKDAHDRYANVEVAFLLQKMEDHAGVVIIATNLAHNIDAAFSRRMQFVVQFPLPDISSRERLWQAMFPAEAPRAPDLDIGFLARQFAFAGGDIRNIALEAAFRSAHHHTAIGMREVLGAVVAHYGKRGKLPHANEFGQYAGLMNGASHAAAVSAEIAPGTDPCGRWVLPSH